MLVKICGIQDEKAAICSAEAGADFIGLVMAKESKRHVPIMKAKEIAKRARELEISVVGVFCNSSQGEIISVCDFIGIHWVQHHGALLTLPERFHQIYVNQKNISTRKGKDYLLFDHEIAGSGQSFDWNSFQPPRHERWFLAGGLNHDNIEKAISQLKPFGVDVSSGVEIEGKKDEDLIESFIKKAKTYG